jgi:hypothetical protein
MCASTLSRLRFETGELSSPETWMTWTSVHAPALGSASAASSAMSPSSPKSMPTTILRGFALVPMASLPSSTTAMHRASRRSGRAAGRNEADPKGDDATAAFVVRGCAGAAAAPARRPGRREPARARGSPLGRRRDKGLAMRNERSAVERSCRVTPCRR